MKASNSKLKLIMTKDDFIAGDVDGVVVVFLQNSSDGTTAAAKVPLGSVRFPTISHSLESKLNFSIELSFFPSNPPNAKIPPSSASILKSCLATLRFPVSSHSPVSKSYSSEVLIAAPETMVSTFGRC